MNRLSIDDVRSAYARTGMRPMRSVWCDDGTGPGDPYGWGVVCGCGLGAVIVDRHGPEPAKMLERMDEDDDESTMAVFRRAASLLGLDPDYVHGFVLGFDLDDPPDQPVSREFEAGYGDGKVAWAAVADEEISP